ncbi:MAG: hypothetical protein H7A25_22180 [Leptospiraceae bacterium]|nr:hypothetical protein [Leptospiraceae bacterium]
MNNPNWGIEVLPESLNWENFKLTLYGNQIVKFSSFEFEEKADIAIVYGASGLPTNWTKKKTEFDAKCALHLDELKVLTTLAAPFGGMLTMLPPAPLTADCVAAGISYGLVIPAIKFKTVKYVFKQGDDKVEVPLDLAVLGFPRITML